MHSRDPNKSEAAFQEEFERILQGAGKGLADFSGFVFVNSRYERFEFAAECSFADARFTRDASFSSAKFRRAATFRGATFVQKADFRWARLTQDADFVGTRFTQAANFTHASFVRTVYFDVAEFAEAAEFNNTEFRSDPPGHDLEPGPIFTGTKFKKPEEVTFYQTHLGQALFHRCDVSKINFSDVLWRRRPSGKRMVFEEDIDPTPDAALDLRPVEGDPNPRNYRLIAELYQQLKKNYDDRRDYWTAGDFHYGEMEMKRLAVAPAGWISGSIGDIIGSARFDALRGWWHRWLGLTALYKYASEYGESYVRPALWLMLVLLVFASVYPVAGLRYDITRGRAAALEPGPPAAQAAGPLLTYWHPLWGSGDKRRWPRLALLGHSSVTTLNVAIFRKDLTYEPRYPWGDLLEVAEQILTSTLVALFLLAVRRQFKR